MVAGMFYLLMFMVIVLFCFRITQYMITSAYVEDALAASNLASAVIDLKEYGKSHVICIQDPEQAFILYREALCHNLQLDEYLNTTNSELLASQVSIEEYIVYNVAEEQVDIYVLDESGQICKYETGRIGEVYTPDSVCVQSTTIYSRVAFCVNGLFEQSIFAKKEQSVDIVRCNSD